MKNLLADVAAFRRIVSLPISDRPTVPPLVNVELHRSLISEEVNCELFPAMDNGDICDIADAMADAIYVIVGAALEYGIPLDRVWRAVQAANMAKVDPVTGTVRRRADGKVLKPEGWQPPDIKRAVYPDSKE